MSDLTKQHVINIDYSCTETGQEANIQVLYSKGKHSYNAEINVTFEPEISDDSKDPMGFLGRLLESIK